MNKSHPNNQVGLSLVEVLVATSVILLFMSALIGAYNIYIRLALANNNTTKAAYLGEEGLEAVKILRDNSWTSNIATLTIGHPYYLYFSGGTWKATTTQSLIDNVFDRKFILYDVYRDSSGDIGTTTDTYDPNIKEVTVYVSWNYHGATTTKSISTYITNLFEQ